MYLRPYSQPDFETLYQLDVLCFKPPFRFTRGTLRSVVHAHGSVVRVACQQDAHGVEVITGFCAATVEQNEQCQVGYIATLDVDPAHRRRGLARVLMQSVEQALAHVVSDVRLHVFTANDAALRLYESLGYKCIHRVENFYGSQLDAWVCVKALQAKNS